MMRPPNIRLVILLEDVSDSDTRHYAAQLLRHIDRTWFTPEVWVLSGGEESSAISAANVDLVYLSNGRRAGPAALARLAARLWRCKPDVLYTLPGLPNIWGPLLAGILRISVVSSYRSPMTRRFVRVLKRFCSRIIANAAPLRDLMTRQCGVEPNQITVIADGVNADCFSSNEDRRDSARERALTEFSVPCMVRRTEKVLREIAQLGATWTTTEDGETPLQLPLRPASANAMPAEKIIERGCFRPDRSLRQVSVATLTVHLPPVERATGAAAVICPGGGYVALSIDKEGHDVARRLTTFGVAGLVLKYRLPRADVTGADTPWPLQDIMRALSIVREHAGEWRIDPRRLGVMGFSAGGHMAGAAANADRHLAFAALIYPVISMEPKLTHKGSRLQLLGAHPGQQLTARYSFENHVTAHTCPTFLVHARDDDVVKVENSIVYADALRRAGVAHEFLFYEKGGHGFGLGSQGGALATWPARFAEWIYALNHNGLEGSS